MMHCSEHFANSSNMSEMGSDSTTNHTGNSHRLINGSSAGIDDGVQYMYYYQSTFYSSNYFFDQRGGSSWLSQTIS